QKTRRGDDEDGRLPPATLPGVDAFMHVTRTIHEKILAVYPKFAEKKVFFRRPDRASRQQLLKPGSRALAVDRDRMVCALLNRMANTKRSIAALCDAALSEDAMSLVRVLMEASTQLAWMLQGDWVRRVDTYILFWTALKRRQASVAVEHFDDPELRAISDA